MTSHRFRLCTIVVLICASSFLGKHALAQLPDSWPPQAPQYHFHMIGNAHIDAPWLWPWGESMSLVLSTFRSALDRMNEDPDSPLPQARRSFTNGLRRQTQR